MPPVAIDAAAFAFSFMPLAAAIIFRYSPYAADADISIFAATPRRCRLFFAILFSISPFCHFADTPLRLLLLIFIFATFHFRAISAADYCLFHASAIVAIFAAAIRRRLPPRFRDESFQPFDITRHDILFH